MDIARVAHEQALDWQSRKDLKVDLSSLSTEVAEHKEKSHSLFRENWGGVQEGRRLWPTYNNEEP